MFCEEKFIADCITFLQSNDYEDYEEVRIDIGLFVKDNLPSNYFDEIGSHLCGKILEEYIACEFENASTDDEAEDNEVINPDDDDYLFNSVEDWLAASTD
jgi:hypothetical protein